MANLLIDTPLFYLRKSFILYLKNTVDNSRTEYCGNLNNNSDILTLITPMYKGESIQGNQRGVCRWKVGKTREYFHTHPYVSKTYPSYEDILSIAAKPSLDRRLSIIATLWGIWYIYKEDYQENLEDDIKEKERLTKVYNEEIALEFYKAQYHKNTSKTHSKPYDNTVKQALYFPLKLFNAEFEKYCCLGFINWDDIISLSTSSNPVPFYRFQLKSDLGFFFRKVSRKVSRKSKRVSRKVSRKSKRYINMV